MTIKVPTRMRSESPGSTPQGVVTFVMTDVGGSTSLWTKHGQAMGRAMQRHDEIVEAVFGGYGGTVLKARGEGDSVFAVFSEPCKALQAAAALLEALRECQATVGVPVNVRVAVHSGNDYVALPGDYRGNAPNRCARIREAAHPGQILASQAASVLARESLPPGFALRSLGTHVLRDLVLPEPLFQLEGPGLRLDFPPPRSLSNHPHNLPVQLTSFIGRAAEIRAVRSALDGTRLLTLWGTGGCGKTRLALQVAAEAFDRFPQGVWSVDFSTISGSDEVAAHMARELAVVDPLGREPLAAVSAHFGVGEALILADSCEHVASGVADAIFDLMRRNPGLVFLATSRQPLGVPGETTYAVPGMDLPAREALIDPAAVGSHDGVRLFVERATARDRSFALAATNAPDVAQLCEMLDGLPFLIEIAAGGTHLLTPKQMREDIGRVLHRKGARGVGAARRHETLEATLQWSYDLLSEPARRMLACLAVFVGGWTLEAAEQVCCDGAASEEDLIDTLDELVRDSLVHSQAGPGETRRFRLLETTRGFAIAKPADREGLRRRHFEFYLRSAGLAWEEWFTEAQESAAARLDCDYPNLSAALNWGYAERDPRLPEFVRSMVEYWMLRGKLKLGREWLERCVGYPGEDRLSRASTLTALGALCMRQGEYRCAQESFEEALAVFQEADAAIDAAIVCSNLAGVSSHLGRMDEARAYLDQSRRAFERADKPYFVTRTLINLGVLDLDAGRHDDEVSELFRQAEDSALRSGDTAMVAVAAGNLGEALLRSGRPAEAAAALARAFAAWRTMADPTEIATSLIDVARLCQSAGRSEDAAQMIAASDSLFAEAGSKLTGRQAAAREAVAGELARTGVQVASKSPRDPSGVAAEAERLLRELSTG